MVDIRFVFSTATEQIIGSSIRLIEEQAAFVPDVGDKVLLRGFMSYDFKVKGRVFKYGETGREVIVVLDVIGKDSTRPDLSVV